MTFPTTTAYLGACALLLLTLLSPAEAQWQTLTPMPLPRSDFQVISYANVFYIHGGCIGNQTVNGGCPLITNRLESYNSATNQWAELTPSPTNRTQYSAAIVGSRIFYIGGRDLDSNVISSVDVYDVLQASWSTLPSQNGATDRSNAAAFVLDSVIYVSGGYDAGYNSLNTSIRLNASSSLPLSSLVFQSNAVAVKPISAGDCGGVAIGGYGYVFAGFSSLEADFNGFCHPLSTLERYSPATNQWTQMASLITARGDPAYAAAGGLLFLMGGEGKLNPSLYCLNGSDLSVPISNVEYYNPATNQWQALDTLPISRFRFSGNVGGGNGLTLFNIGGQAGEVITNSSLDPTNPYVDSGYWPVVPFVEARDVSAVVAAANNGAAGQTAWGLGWAVAMSLVGAVLVA